MLVKIAPLCSRSGNPEDAVQNQTVVFRLSTAAGAARPHKRSKKCPFLIAHQTTNQISLPSERELESRFNRFVNPLCQQNLVNQVRELQRLLGKKTLETEILKEALEQSQGQKNICCTRSRFPDRPGRKGFQNEACLRHPARCPLEHCRTPQGTLSQAQDWAQSFAGR